MAFPASQLRLAPVLDQIAGVMSGLRGYALVTASSMGAGNVAANVILEAWFNLKAQKARLQSLGATPGIAAFAQEQYNNANLNIVTEFNSVIAAIDNVTANIEGTFPKDASGFLLAAQFGGDGTISYRQFTPAQLATLAGLLNTLAGTIS